MYCFAKSVIISLTAKIICGKTKIQIENINIASRGLKMSSDYEKHVYGSAPRTNKDWSKANPHKLKLTSIPENRVCGFCDTVKDYVFALSDVVVCYKCANEILERKDIQYGIKPYKGTPMDPMFCARCGNDVVEGVSLNIRLCNECITKAGKFELRWRGRRIRRASGARKVA
jgi:hypothetical protein